MRKGKKKLEADFQHSVIKELEERFPGCVVRKNQAGYTNGFPDVTVFIGEHWAMLECKREEDAAKRPNQDYWVDRLNEMSFASFIFPENREEVMNALQQAFGA